MSERSLPYDPKSRRSIVEYAQMLMGSTLREHVDVDSIDDPSRRKGSFGNAVEEYYFFYDINSDSRPDFAEVGLELKTTPLKKNRDGSYSAKERLVLSMISYADVVSEEFETSSLVKKASDILLISYVHEDDVNPLDYPIEIVAEWGLPEADMPQFKRDWETVVKKVREGRAHEISGSDTMYLEACTKGATGKDRRSQPFSDVPAKPRAWALKASYMTAVSRGLIEQMEELHRDTGEEELGLAELVRRRFEPFFGLSELELAEEFGYSWKSGRKPKHACALITRRILGVADDAEIAEFAKAGVKPKTMRLTRSGRPKEAVSFPAFDYCELAETDFWESDFHARLQTKYLFVIYRQDAVDDALFTLDDVLFWQMPDADLDEAERCYEMMRARVIAGHADRSVTSRENRCCHVRPHGRNAADTCMTPQGVPVTKKCFWLNQGYLKEQIAQELEKR